MFFVYDSTLRVPLVFSWPGRLPAGARVRGQFRSVDLLATVLDLAGVPAPPTSGASRAAFLQPGGRIPDNESYAESLYAQLHFGYAPLRALRGEGWKLIDVPRPELYRLAEDPHETRNLVDERSPVAAAMRASLQRFDRQSGLGPELPAVDEAVAERLAALGYVGGGPAPGGPPSGVDLKDRIGEVQAYTRGMREGIRLYRDRDFDGAIRLLRRLSETQAPSFNVQYYLGRSLLDERRFAEAIPHLRKAAEMAPTRRTLSGLAAAPIYAYLVEAYAGAGQTKAAMETLEQALKVAPANAELLRAKGGLLLQQGSLPEARAALEKARSIDPGEPRLHAELSNVYRNLGRPRAGPGRGARGAAPRPEVARGPPRQRPRAGRARARGRGGRRVPRGASPRAVPPGRALLPGIGGAAGGARRGGAADSREARREGARLPAGPRDARPGAAPRRAAPRGRCSCGSCACRSGEGRGARAPSRGRESFAAWPGRSPRRVGRPRGDLGNVRVEELARRCGPRRPPRPGR